MYNSGQISALFYASKASKILNSTKFNAEICIQKMPHFACVIPSKSSGHKTGKAYQSISVY
jgi:hypothetical protein